MKTKKIDKTAEIVTKLSKHFGKGVIRPASENGSVRKMLLWLPEFDYVSQGGVIINRINEFIGSFSGLKTYHALKTIAEFQRYDWANNVQRAFVKFEYEQKFIDVASKKSEDDDDKASTKKTKVKKSRTKKATVSEEDEEEQISEKVPIHVISGYTLRRGYAPKKTPKPKRVAFVDIEGTYDSVWAEKHGIDNKGLLYIQPDTLAEAVDITQALLSDPDICLVVVDSLSAVGADVETDTSMESEQMSANARFWNKGVRKFQAGMNNNPERDVTLIVINSTYDKVGFVLGNPEQVKNGSQLKLAKSLSMRFQASGEFKNKDKETVGRHINVKCLKNKAGRPFLDLDFIFSLADDGFYSTGETDVYHQLVAIGVRTKIIERAGSSYKWAGQNFRGMETIVKALMDDPSLYKKVRDDVYKTFLPNYGR